MYTRGRGIHVSFQILRQSTEFENSREYWRVSRYHDRVPTELKKSNKITESGFLIEIARSSDKPLEDNGLLDQAPG